MQLCLLTQSRIDVITNSSSEIFVICEEYRSKNDVLSIFKAYPGVNEYVLNYVENAIRTADYLKFMYETCLKSHDDESFYFEYTETINNCIDTVNDFTYFDDKLKTYYNIFYNSHEIYKDKPFDIWYSENRLNYNVYASHEFNDVYYSIDNILAYSKLLENKNLVVLKIPNDFVYEYNLTGIGQYFSYHEYE